jgi:hypothetical protein
MQHSTVSRRLTRPVGLLACLLFVFAIQVVRARLARRRLGYAVIPEGRDCIVYAEDDGGGGTRRFRLDGELLVGSRNVIHVPDQKAWPGVVPAWATDRRTEILRRIKFALGTVRYEFQEWSE